MLTWSHRHNAVSGSPLRTSRPLTLLALLVALGAAGCKNTNFLSTKDEVNLGRDISREIEKTNRVETDSEDAKRVQRIGERILQHIDDRKGVPYSFKMLDNKEINAVSLPGGPIYIFRGLLDLMGDDDDALAAVMGHEIGHINARHAAKHISQQYLTTLGIAVLVQGRNAQNIASLTTDLISLAYSREDEYESDRRGLSYAYKAGFDPRGLIRFFAKLAAMEKKGGGGPEFFRTHPITKARIERAERIIERQEYRYGR